MSIESAMEEADAEFAAWGNEAQELARIVADRLQSQPRIALAALIQEHPQTVAVELVTGRQFFLNIELP